MTIQLFNGDCLQVMPTLEAQSFDAIIADLPYGTTACKWDTVIPFAPLWAEYKRLIKPRGAIVLFGSQPFTSLLVTSNLEWFKYEWAWNKNTTTGVASAEYAPMKSHENISVFSRNGHTFNRQKTPRFSSKSADRYKYPVQSGLSPNHYASLEPLSPKQYDPDFVNPRTSLELILFTMETRCTPPKSPSPCLNT